MSSNGWRTAGLHPSGAKKLSVGSATVQLKLMTGGRYRGQQRIYGQPPSGGWYAAVIDADGRLLGYGVGRTKADAREEMLAAAGLDS